MAKLSSRLRPLPLLTLLHIVSASQFSYEITSGTCPIPITSLMDCEVAGLSINSTTATSYYSSLYASGCVHHGTGSYSLWLNTFVSSIPCSSAYPCFCLRPPLRQQHSILSEHLMCDSDNYDATSQTSNFEGKKKHGFYRNLFFQMLCEIKTKMK
eukprot:m.236917 g.236917  ORF g.236917 m.236917 type:complete len:155 (+) comp33694_c0_seq3:213-677(+)